MSFLYRNRLLSTFFSLDFLYYLHSMFWASQYFEDFCCNWLKSVKYCFLVRQKTKFLEFQQELDVPSFKKLIAKLVIPEEGSESQMIFPLLFSCLRLSCYFPLHFIVNLKNHQYWSLLSFIIFIWVALFSFQM